MSGNQKNQVQNMNAIGAVILVLIAASWGLNHVVMKWAYKDISPVLQAGLRSVIAWIGLVIYCRWKSIPLKAPGVAGYHGFIVGLLFSLDFLLLYIGLDMTLASRGAVLFYIQPVITALGAHFLVPGERLTTLKSMGLALAFGGAAWVLMSPPESGQASLTGDLLCLGAGAAWAALNLYVKRELTNRVSFYVTLNWELVWSIPFLMVGAFVLETPRLDLTWGLTGAMLFQGMAVAVVSYLIFLKMIYRYSAAGVTSFTLLTPVFSVGLSMLVLGETLTLGLIGGLALVSAGVWLVNKN